MWTFRKNQERTWNKTYFRLQPVHFISCYKKGHPEACREGPIPTLTWHNKDLGYQHSGSWYPRHRLTVSHCLLVLSNASVIAGPHRAPWHQPLRQDLVRFSLRAPLLQLLVSPPGQPPWAPGPPPARLPALAVLRSIPQASFQGHRAQNQFLMSC